MRIHKGETYYKKPWFNSYRCMMDRCYREKNVNYKRYGGRGITVCEEWHEIRNFEKWVEENPYFEGATLDRIDYNGNYEPSNCRWADMKTQCNNRSSCVILEYNGEKHNITEWAKILGVNRSTLINRKFKGWNDKDIITIPTNPKNQYMIKRGANNE